MAEDGSENKKTKTQTIYTKQSKIVVETTHMVELTEVEKGVYHCTCAQCGDNIRMKDEVHYLSIDAVFGQQMNKVQDGYESPGFCSKACLMSWLHGKMTSEYLHVIADSYWQGGEE